MMEQECDRFDTELLIDEVENNNNNNSNNNNDNNNNNNVARVRAA